MEWQNILYKLRIIKEDFDKSYKCLNVERNIKDETIAKHLKILLDKFERIRVILNVNYNRLTTAHKAAAENFFSDVRSRIVTLLAKKGLEIKLPTSLHEESVYKLEKTTPEANEVLIELFNREENPKTITKMTQTVVEFINTASKLIAEFDGKPENLRSFIDSLELLNTIKDNHEATAVSLIKTKLRGGARNLISSEQTISEIINKLKCSIKGESVEVLTAKIMNTRQNNKTANTYCSEIESLTKSLENAYISDGLPCELANKYSTQVAVKALTKNCTIDKVKLIMEAGQFSNMNEAVSKFINSCTEATGQQNSILHFGQRYNRGSYRGNNRQFRGRPNTPRNNANGGFRNQRPSDNYRNQPNQNNRRRYGNYVRAAESQENDSENSEEPLR